MAERKKYTDEQKAEILKFAEENSASAASKEFGVSRMTIAAWRSAAKMTAESVEVKKNARAAGRKAKESVDTAVDELKEKTENAVEDAKETAEAVKAEKADKKAANQIEAKKSAAAARRSAGEKVEKFVGDVKAAADEAKLVGEIEKGKKKAASDRKKAENQAKIEDAKEAAKAPGRKMKAAKLNINIQSPMGGVITPEEIASKVPKEATDVYVKIDENKIYWVGKDQNGSVDIWE